MLAFLSGLKETWVWDSKNLEILELGKGKNLSPGNSLESALSHKIFGDSEKVSRAG